MDYLTHPMNIIKSNQTLSCKPSDKGHWDALIVVSLDNFQEIDTQNFEDHDKMLTVWAIMNE